jgi:hypothetical protein
VPYQSFSLAQLQTLLYQRVEGKPWWSTPEATAAINEGLRVWNAATGFWVGQQFCQTVPNDPYVALTSTMVRSARVLFNGIPLEKTDQASLDYGIPGWRSATTTTTGHPTRPSYWAPVALNLLLLYPADAAGLNAIEVNGVRTTPVLSDTDPTAYVDFPESDLGRLLAYAVHVLAFKVGGPTLVASYPGWLDFLRTCAEQNRQFAASTFFRRVLGMDQQYRLHRQRVPVQTPVGLAVEQGAATTLPGAGS